MNIPSYTIWFSKDGGETWYDPVPLSNRFDLPLESVILIAQMKAGDVGELWQVRDMNGTVVAGHGAITH
jgi:hypothetical protein